MFFIVSIAVAVIVYNAYTSVLVTNYLANRNEMCALITDSLKEQINETSACIDYYCYYAPYAPPSGELQDRTSTVCVCDCRQRDNTVITVQILGVNSQ